MPHDQSSKLFLNDHIKREVLIWNQVWPSHIKKQKYFCSSQPVFLLAMVDKPEFLLSRSQISNDAAHFYFNSSAGTDKHVWRGEASGYQLEQQWESRHDESLPYSLPPTWKVLCSQLCLRPKPWGHSLKLLMNPCRPLWSEILRQNQHRTNAFYLMFASWKLRAKISLCKNRKKINLKLSLYGNSSFLPVCVCSLH